MTDPEFSDYLKGRYATQLDWYDKRATLNKRWYRALSLYVLVGAAFLTVANRFEGADWRVIDALIAASISVSVGALGLFKCHENWLGYRATWDLMKQEPELRIAGIGPYRDTLDRNALFVERIEGFKAQEKGDWLLAQRQKPPTKSA